MDGNVRIGREFFQKIKLDYADWRWALVREFLQNSMDAPRSTRIDVTVSRDGANTLLKVENNGEPMTRDVLVNKLLTLGGSGKNFAGSVGGFGVAKSLLYYTHLHYTIHTGNLLVDGEGGQYKIDETAGFPGTVSTVLIEGDVVSDLIWRFNRFASMAQWDGTLTVNGEELDTNLRKGMRRKEFSWGVVYTNRSFSNLCLVRLNGQPMFSRICRFSGCVLVELKGTSGDVLTSNRDGLKDAYANQLNDLLTALAVDKRSALREERAEYKRWRGERQRIEAEKPKAVGEVAAILDGIDFGGGVTVGGETVGTPVAQAPKTLIGSNGPSTVAVSREESSVSIGPEFIIKNTTGRQIPMRFQPEKFSKYAKDLIRAWTGVLVKLHQVLNVSSEFSVGFVFDNESLAQAERSGAYGLVYYINPAKLVHKVKRDTFDRRFNSVWKDRSTIISEAAHEIVHGAYGLKDHDEDYAAKLTDVMAVALREHKKLDAVCRKPRKIKEVVAV